MLNNFSIEKYRYLIFCTIAGFCAFSTSVSYLILDSNFLFHEGEYVGLLWHMRSFYSGDTVFPWIIHGAMDYIPSLVAAFIYGDDHIIVGTRVINTIITLSCWVIFLDLCYLMTSKTSQRKFWVVIALLIFYAITPKLNSQALIVQQAFLGTRDLFIILTVWFFAKYTISESLISGRSFLILGTISAIVAIFWSYDRGIMATAFLGIMFVNAAINNKKLDAAILILTALCSLLILNHSNIFGSFIDNIQIIIYWVGNAAEIFGTKFFNDLPYFIISSFILLFCVTTIVFALTERFYKDRKFLFLILGIFAIQIILLKTVMNRPGMPRLSWAIWPSILMMLHFSSKRFPLNFSGTLSFSFSSIAKVGNAYKAYFLILSTLVFVMSPLFFWYGSFLKNTFKPKLDTEIVSTEINNLANTLRQFNDQCVLGWTNEGVIALMTKKRNCTKYTYAIYVSKDEEFKFLSELKDESPAAIVFGITGPSMMDVDNRSMQTRLPKVNKFIEENYKNRQQVGRYLVVSK